MKMLTVAIMMACVSLSAMADDAEYTGMNLQSLCETAPHECSAFALGFVSGAAAYQQLGNTFCPPPAVKVPQLTLVISKFLRDHPERLHEDAWRLAGTALSIAFPCHRSN